MLSREPTDAQVAAFGTAWQAEDARQRDAAYDDGIAPKRGDRTRAGPPRRRPPRPPGAAPVAQPDDRRMTP